MPNEKGQLEDYTSDLGLEARKVKALEKIAMNLEGILMFCESLEVEDWNDRLQWYLDMFKRAYLDSKLENK